MAKIEKYTQTLRNLLDNPPSQGERHLWMRRLAFSGIRFKSADNLRTFLENVVEGMGWNDRDFTVSIENAVTDAAESLNVPVGERVKKAKDTDRRSLGEAEICYKTIDSVLKNPSIETSFSWDLGQDIAQQAFLRMVGGKTVFAHDQKGGKPTCKKAEELAGGLHYFQFFCLNSAIDPNGPRTLGNVKDEKDFLVLECDLTELSFDEKNKLLFGMSSELIPLVCVVFSGGKSLHGYYDASKLTFFEKKVWYRFAVKAGHDRSLWVHNFWSRIPGGTRGDVTQKVTYYNA